MAEKIKVKTRARNAKGESRSFWRAGIRHTPDWAEHEVDAGTLEVLEAEPMVEVLRQAQDAPKKGAPKKK